MNILSPSLVTNSNAAEAGNKKMRNNKKQNNDAENLTQVLSEMEKEKATRTPITFGNPPPASTIVDLTALLPNPNNESSSTGFFGRGRHGSDKEDEKKKEVRTQMRDLLHARGWCFVRLPESMRLQKPLENALHKFFAESAESKSRYEAPFGYGYSAVDHKEGLRFLTGYSRLTAFMEEPGLPQSMQKPIKGFCDQLDETFLFILDELAEMMQVPRNEMALKADLPVAFLSESHFGMLDITHYFNAKAGADPQPAEGSSVDEVNCVPHYDPGLVSISFFSDCEGLQLKDPETGEWINGPVNTNPDQADVGVLWLGQAAVVAFDGQLKVQ